MHVFRLCLKHLHEIKVDYIQASTLVFKHKIISLNFYYLKALKITENQKSFTVYPGYSERR